MLEQTNKLYNFSECSDHQYSLFKELKKYNFGIFFALTDHDFFCNDITGFTEQSFTWHGGTNNN